MIVDVTRTTDVHQHLWPEPFVDALRARTRSPRLRDWVLETAGEPAFICNPADHDADARRRLDRNAGVDRAVVSLSSPLGIEWMQPEDGQALLDAWHQGALALGDGFEVWAAASVRDPAPEAVTAALDLGCVGLQVPADAMATPRDLDRIAVLLQVCERRDVPVLVHPGPATATADLPGWWAPVVDYTTQLQAAWWAWRVEGRRLLPALRICFVAGAGLAPLQHERFAARGGRPLGFDPGVFVDTSSYGPRAVGALVRALGVDPVVLGSDRPYAEPTDLGLDAAATAAVRGDNPRRLLQGTTR
jgi:predicted TIM-barrel fold metal-dependent hydrolase